MTLVSQNGINNTVGASISGVTNTMTVQNPSNTSSSGAQVLITVGGTTATAPWLQWTVGTTESFALGQNNSASQKLYLNYAASASVSPTTGTNMCIFDQSVPGMVLAAGASTVFNTQANAVGTNAVNGLSIYEIGTFTPTMIGAGTAGVTSYTTQTGNYIRQGNFVQIRASIIFTAATGTGNVNLGSFPFTITNTDANRPVGCARMGGSGWTWPASTTNMNFLGVQNATTAIVQCAGSATNAVALTMSNAAGNIRYNCHYRI